MKAVVKWDVDDSNNISFRNAEITGSFSTDAWLNLFAPESTATKGAVATLEFGELDKTDVVFISGNAADGTFFVTQNLGTDQFGINMTRRNDLMAYINTHTSDATTRTSNGVRGIPRSKQVTYDLLPVEYSSLSEGTYELELHFDILIGADRV